MLSFSPSGRGTIWLLLCSRPRSKKHPREASGKCSWRCCDSWHCLPMLELLGACGVSVMVAMALCLPTDGAALGAEEGTALLKPEQCLSTVRRQEKDEKSWFPGGEVLQRGSRAGPSLTPIASCRPAGLRLPLGQGRRVSVSPPLLPSLAACPWV